MPTRKKIAIGAWTTPTGLNALRESRGVRSRLADRLASFADGQAIVFDGEEALGEFLDSIDAEVDAELQAQH